MILLKYPARTRDKGVVCIVVTTELIPYKAERSCCQGGGDHRSLKGRAPYQIRNPTFEQPHIERPEGHPLRFCGFALSAFLTESIE